MVRETGQTDVGVVLWDLRWNEGIKRKKMVTKLTMGLFRQKKASLGATGCRTGTGKCQRNGSDVENTHCSCRGHGFESQHLNDSL